MKYRNLLLLGLVITIVITGCGVPSVHPLYEKEDLITQESFNGEWKSPDENSSYVVSLIEDLQKEGELKNFFNVENDSTNLGIEISFDDDEQQYKNLYLIKAEEDGEKNLYLAGLLKLNENFYLDFYKWDFEEDYFSHPVHIFVKAEISDQKIILHQFKESFIKELIENRQLRIKHEEAMNRFLLTASTQELQDFIIKYGNDAKAYRSETIKLAKQANR